tara:strand:- start:194 stop:298 length:105 start_codon:yes stop_codon:yes gene_type:complete
MPRERNLKNLKTEKEGIQIFTPQIQKKENIFIRL